MFRFAIMGAGNIARHFCEAVELVDGCAVCAVASKSPERAERFAKERGIPSFYDDYGRMIEEHRPDCVYVATTTDAHYELSMLCVEHNTPVLCEKAMFTSTGDARACFREAEARRVFAMEAMWSRFLPAIQCAREWVASGRIGRPVCAEMSLGFQAPDDPANRYFNPALGGGAAFDLTVYGHELLTWVLDRAVTRVSAEVMRAPTGVDASELVLLRLGGDVPATITASLEARLDEKMAIYGTAGKIVIPRAHMAMEALLYGADGAVVSRFVDRETQNGFVYEIMDVMDAVRGGRTQSDTVPHSATLACAEMFDQILS